MSKKDDQRQQAIERLAEHLLATGLSQTSLRQLAAAAGVSDRMLLYYFDDKSDVLSSALGKIASDLMHALNEAAPDGQRLAAHQLIQQTAALTSAPQTKPYFRLWTEIIAGVVRDPNQYRSLARSIAEGFLDWIERRLAGDDPKSKRASAAMILAMIDGLALLEICTDEKTAAAAAEQMASYRRPDA